MRAVLLSQTSRYALRAAIHLAEHEGDRPVTVGEIARALRAPRNYLSKIMHVLAREGVLVSERGPGGGFRLGAAPEKLSLACIVEPLEPGLGRRRCLLGRPHCSDADPCAVHERWRPFSDGIGGFLEGTSLGDLLQQQRRRPARVAKRRGPARHRRRPPR